MEQESRTHVFMTLNKTDQEWLVIFGIVTATKTANEGRIHAERTVQRDEGRALRAREDSLGSCTARVFRVRRAQTPRNEDSVTVHDRVKLTKRR